MQREKVTSVPYLNWATISPDDKQLPRIPLLPLSHMTQQKQMFLHPELLEALNIIRLKKTKKTKLCLVP